MRVGKETKPIEAASSANWREAKTDKANGVQDKNKGGKHQIKQVGLLNKKESERRGKQCPTMQPRLKIDDNYFLFLNS